VSQGAIGVCARAGDEHSLQWLRSLDHAATRVAVTAERALLRRIEGGCQVPLGALATLSGNRLTLRASVCALDGSVSMDCDERTHLDGNPSQLATAAALGVFVAEQLLARGAGVIIAEQRRPANQDLP
jgi:hydroxymethylbilane synthase